VRDAGPVTGPDHRRTTATHALYVFVSCAAFFGPLLDGGMVLLFGDAWNWWRVLVVSLVYGCGMALVEVWQTRRPGTLAGRLDREAEQLRRDRRAVPIQLGVAALLVALVALTTDTAAAGLWAYVAAAGVAAAVAPAWVRRRLQRVEGRRQQVSEPAG
jgi:MFS family permease